mgnify:CR=1 FL=1
MLAGICDLCLRGAFDPHTILQGSLNKITLCIWGAWRSYQIERSTPFGLEIITNCHHSNSLSLHPIYLSTPPCKIRLGAEGAEKILGVYNVIRKKIDRINLSTPPCKIRDSLQGGGWIFKELKWWTISIHSWVFVSILKMYQDSC